MADSAPGKIPTAFEVWSKYEDVAMHFNDMIIRLRFQALAGVAGITAIVGVLGRSGSGVSIGSNLIGGIFLVLLFFWIAIWMLDRLYYDKLLMGAVAALIKLERESRNPDAALHLDLSTTIEKAVVGGDVPDLRAVCFFKDGRNWFYLIVAFTLLLGSMLHFFDFNLAISPRQP